MQLQPIDFSDDARDALMRLATPIALELRESFLEAVVAEVRRYPPEAIGPGLIFRTVKGLQREITSTLPRMSAKYR